MAKQKLKQPGEEKQSVKELLLKYQNLLQSYLKAVSCEHGDKPVDGLNRIRVPKNRTVHVWNLEIWQR